MSEDLIFHFIEEAERGGLDGEELLCEVGENRVESGFCLASLLLEELEKFIGVKATCMLLVLRCSVFECLV